MESYLSHQHPKSYVSVLSHLSHVGQVGQSYGILPVPTTPSILCVSPMEYYLSHQHKSILCVRPIPLVPCRTSGTVLWNTTCPTIGQVGQSYGILAVQPTSSILCVRPIPPVPCRTSGTVLWNPTCPTNILNPMIPLVPCRTSGTVLWNPTCPTNTLNPMCPSYPTCPM